MKQATMKEIFEQCQNSMKSHSNLLKQMEKIYDKTGFTEFWSEFNHYLKYPMIIFQREPVVEKTIDFIAKFVTSVNPDPNTPGTNPDDSILDEVSQNKLLLEMFEFLLKSHNATSRSVRFRVCQLINKILNNLGDDAQIDDDLYDKIYQCMLERLRDKEPVVRFHAVMALARLQDPKDDSCPIIKAYLYLIQYDPNSEVRRAVLTCIAPSPKTLTAVLEKTRDVKDTVRKTAYKVLGEKVHIKALSIANRERLLQEGLTDRVEGVKEACSSKLLQAWLRTFGGNVLELLGALDVEYATETCELVLNTLFKHSPISELIKNFDILDDKILIPQEKLNAESVLYWNMLCKHLNGLGTDYDADLEKVLPNCLEFAKYIKEYVDTLKGCEDIDLQLQKHFVIQQLISITTYMDLTDTVSRKSLEQLLNYMLTSEHVAFNLVKYVVPRLCEIKDFSEGMVIQMAETISEIREPITTVEKDVNEEMRRQNDIKIAGIRVKINQLKEDLDDSVRNQDFNKAQEIKNQIRELDEERDQVLKENEPQVEEVKSERTDVATLLKCQAIVAEMLEALPLKTLNPSLQTLIETLILPGIMNEDAGIRNLAVRSLGLCCLLNKDLVLVHLPLFMQASQIDVEIVRVTALKVMIDLLHMHGTEAIKPGPTTQKPADLNTSGDLYEEPDNNSEQASKLVAFLTAFLDSQNSELRTIAAEGMAKLMLSGRVVSSKILSHLLLLWYNPVTEDDTYLRHCLGTFLPIFAFAGRSNQEIVEEAFLPTLKTITGAPLSSPLAEVNADNVAELLVQLTNTKLLLENQKSEEPIFENPGHDNLAIALCNEILSNTESHNIKLLVRILNQLEFSSKNLVNLKEIAVLTDKLSKTIKDNQCLKTIEKIKNHVRSLLPEESAMTEEENTETETEAVTEVGGGDTMNSTNDRSALNDTAQQLDGSLFQESRTLKRIKSISSQKSMDASELEVDVREIQVFPDIQEEPETPRLIGVKTPAKSAKKTPPAKNIKKTPAKGQKGSPAQPLKPTRLVDRENTEDKTKDQEKTTPAKAGSPRGRTPTKRKPSDDAQSPSQKKTSKKDSPARKDSENKSPKRKGSPASKSPKRKESPARKSPIRKESPASKSPKRKESPAGKSPKRKESPAGRSTRKGKDEKKKSPVRGQTPAKRKATSDEKSPTKHKSPRQEPSRSTLRNSKKSPSRNTTPVKRRIPREDSSPVVSKSPKTSVKDKDTARNKSPVIALDVKAAANKGKQTETPTKSKTGTPSKIPTPLAKSQSKATASPKESPITRRTRGVQSPAQAGKPTRPGKTDSPLAKTRARGTTDSENSTPKTDSPLAKTRTRGAPSSDGEKTTRPNVRKANVQVIPESPSPVKTSRVRGRKQTILSDDEMSTDSSVVSPRGKKRTVVASSEEDNTQSTDTSISSVRRNTRRGRNISGDSDIPSTDSSILSSARNTRKGRNISGDSKKPAAAMKKNTRRGKIMSEDDDLPSTDSTLKASPKKIKKMAPPKKTGNKTEKAKSVGDSEDELASTDTSIVSVTRTTRRKVKETDTDDSPVATSTAKGRTTRTKRSTAAKTTTDDDTDSSVVSSSRATRKKVTSRSSVTLKELVDSDSEVNSPQRPTRKPARGNKKTDLETIISDSGTEEVFESPARSTRSAKPKEDDSRRSSVRQGKDTSKQTTSLRRAVRKK